MGITFLLEETLRPELYTSYMVYLVNYKFGEFGLNTNWQAIS